MLYFWTVAITSLAECFVSMQRIEEFLLSPNQNTAVVGHVNYALTPDTPSETDDLPIKRVIEINANSSEKSIIFKNVTAKWNAAKRPGIVDVTIEARGNQLITINGPVAAGKSTILLTILRELEIQSGELSINGVVSYSSQEPWLFDATIRQNIIFAEQFDEQRYSKVIQICNLENDIRSLPFRDLTIVGESGICLSGGQKSRINLARAIYQKADIYLLDDPFSAVDVTVGKFIFDNCIKSFLGDKIRILVTHQEQYLMASDWTIFIRNGKIHHRRQNYVSLDYTKSQSQNFSNQV